MSLPCPTTTLTAGVEAGDALHLDVDVVLQEAELQDVPGQAEDGHSDPEVPPHIFIGERGARSPGRTCAGPTCRQSGRPPAADHSSSHCFMVTWGHIIYIVTYYHSPL